MNEFILPGEWPGPADAGAAERLVERFGEAGAAEEQTARSPEARSMLAAIGGNSPFLADLAVREAASVLRFVKSGPDGLVADALGRLRATPVTARREEVAGALRRAKRVVALAAALADIGGIWPVERFTAVMTELAESALELSVANLLLAAHERGDVVLTDPERPAADSGFVVLGMGKLGARELNYSSDIDLILIYDPDAPIYTGRIGPEAIGGFMSRLARDLVGLMERRDGDGYVFRTDLRLRPDPAVTPPAVSLPAALTYYESMGQNWERAAMIKARPVAGDLAAGAAFLEAIRPFVWRRGLDFAAVADIHALKRRIDAHRGTEEVSGLAGLNVKLGRGGIREIEFLAQTLQMVWGGRDPGLRDPTTLGALAALERAGHLAEEAVRELSDAYRFLRRVEHRLQMVADRQVHNLPERREELARFATFMGCREGAFESVLGGHLDRVQARYAAVFGEDDSSAMALDFRGADPAPSTVAGLRKLGFSDTDRVIAAVRGWQVGRYRALRSGRARELLEHMLPGLLAALGRQGQPDATLGRFDMLLSRLPSGVQILSMFDRNPALLERVAGLLGAAPSLAEHLASHPAALEGLVSPDAGSADPEALLKVRLRDGGSLEEVIAIVRRTVREEDFAISAATLEGWLDVDAAGERRSALAEAALEALLGPVMEDFARRYGAVRGGEMVVVALGKVGGREMMAGSDLDLMLVYDHSDREMESDGPRRLPVSQYFLRASHTYVAALTSPGADGQLYAVDMRLRPSGNKGPVAVSLGAFRRYHAESAWTWERMALTRARVVAGPAELRARVEAAIAETLEAAGPAAQVQADAAEMRGRMLRELPASGPWDVKLRAGGQIEVEFIAQTLQLMAGDRAVCSPTTRVALGRLAEAGLLEQADLEVLVGADRLWRSVQGMLRITVGRAVPAEVPGSAVQALLAATGAVDGTGLRATMETTATRVRESFERYVGRLSDGSAG